MARADIVACILVCIYCVSLSDATCSIDVLRQFHVKQPLLLTSDQKFIYPPSENHWHLNFSQNSVLDVACPGASLNFHPGSDYERLTCVDSGHFIDSQGQERSLETIACDKDPRATARITGHTCQNGIHIEIGFKIKYDKFLRTIDLCHDEDLGHTHWAHSEILPVLDSQQRQARSKFAKNGFFSDIPIDDIYRGEMQYNRFLDIFQDAELVNFYHSHKSRSRKDLFLARGHLAANSDFFYGAQKRSALSYLNAVPMWQVINNGNWRRIENYVRYLASETNSVLDVWTGSLGVLELPDSDGILRTIYLGRTAWNVVPVPKFLVKVVYDAEEHEGIVFLTVNNPHLESKHDHVICNVYKGCLRRALFRTFRDKRLGYTYCCRYKDFVLENPDLGLPDYLRSMGTMSLV